MASMPVVRVESAEDGRLAGYRAVSDPELARTHGLFVAEGRRVVRRLLEVSTAVPQSVLVTESARQSLADVLEARPDLDVFETPQAVMNAVAGFNIHRGCVALALRPPLPAWEELATRASRLVVLEGVGDADNVGSVFRCAAAFGAGGVLLGPACADPLYRKAIRTSMAATLSVPFAIAVPWPDVLAALQFRGWLVVGLTPRPDQEPLWEAGADARHRRTALVFGHEGDGLTRAALGACNVLARIPMAPGVDSLNVAVSVGVALYELARTPYAETES
jgi:tRNA G18 (ribose-2'-O)-methylase SpoU